MKSWVRYSVAVYLGLMIAGALGMGNPQDSGVMPLEPWGYHPPYPHERLPYTWHRSATEVREETLINGKKVKRQFIR